MVTALTLKEMVLQHVAVWSTRLIATTIHIEDPVVRHVHHSSKTLVCIAYIYFGIHIIHIFTEMLIQ